MLPAALEESASTAGPSKARKRIGIGILGVLLAAGIASCGGTRQDANEPSGDFPVQIVSADFPSRQQLAQNTNLTLAVANSGDKTIPNLAITIFTASNENPGADETTTTGTGTTSTTNDLPTVQGSFSVRSAQQGLAIPFRPVWILETGYPKLEGETASAGAEAAHDVSPLVFERHRWHRDEDIVREKSHQRVEIGGLPRADELRHDRILDG